MSAPAPQIGKAEVAAQVQTTLCKVPDPRRSWM